MWRQVQMRLPLAPRRACEADRLKQFDHTRHTTIHAAIHHTARALAQYGEVGHTGYDSGCGEPGILQLSDMMRRRNSGHGSCRHSLLDNELKWWLDELDLGSLLDELYVRILDEVGEGDANSAVRGRADDLAAAGTDGVGCEIWMHSSLHRKSWLMLIALAV